jgi:hypothetical protein
MRSARRCRLPIAGENVRGDVQTQRTDLSLAVCSLLWGATFVVVKNARSRLVFLFLAVRFSASDREDPRGKAWRLTSRCSRN